MRKFLVILICISSLSPLGCSRQRKLDKFVKLYAMPYSITSQNVSKDQVPLLHKMLRDKKYAPYWHNIARTIGYISNDPNSVFALLDYFQRDDSWNLDTVTKLWGKIDSLYYVGYIGGESANMILRSGVTAEGAQELAQNWIDKNYELNDPYIQNRENVINRIRRSALLGLALTDTKENGDLIKALYEQERSYCEVNKVKTRSFQMIADVMALQEYVSEIGTQAYKTLPEQEKLDAILPIADKYNKLKWVDQLNAEGF